jgi:hypothetical protein
MTTRAAIELLVDRTYPDLTLSWDPTLPNPALPQGTILTGAASTHVAALASAVGGEFRFDADGVPEVVRSSLIEDDAPAITWTTGTAGTIINRTDTATRTDIWNAVSVVGEAEGSATTPSGFASIASGPMRYGGPFGRRVRAVDAPNLKTNAECQALANDLVGDGNGLPHAITLTVVPNPAVQAGDVAIVADSDTYTDTYVDEWAGTAFTHRIDAVTIGMGANDPMRVDTQSRLVSPVPA